MHFRRKTDSADQKVSIFWDPAGFELDSLGSKQILSLADGDTPSVSMSVRMLSVDTPEAHYPGTTNPAKHDAALKQLADWMREGRAPIHSELAEFLAPKLATGKAGSLQKVQADAATAAFQRLIDERLTLPSGHKRTLMLRVADSPFDQYGRLLAYVAPKYTPDELTRLTLRERATFNLLMVDSGWGALFFVYPSLPKYADLVLSHQAAVAAVEAKRGAWADPLSLLGYEFRMCIRLFSVVSQLVEGKKLSSAERNSWIERYCADMVTREIFPPQLYYKVQPANRLFIWPKDVNAAVAQLNLTPGA